MPSTYQAGRWKRAGEGGAVAVQGFDQLVRALRRIEGGVEPELKLRLREIGSHVALLGSHYAPRMSGALQHSIKVSAFAKGASVYSTSMYGGVQNVGGGPRLGWSFKGPHVRRENASHYMDRAVKDSSAFVEAEVQKLMDWLLTTFLED